LINYYNKKNFYPKLLTHEQYGDFKIEDREDSGYRSATATKLLTRVQYDTSEYKT